MAYKVGRCLLQDQLDKRKMSQAELARKLDVTRQQISHYLSKDEKHLRVMSLQTAKNIALILNCSIDDLYEWIEVGSKE